jgi:hypothetical protein
VYENYKKTVILKERKNEQFSNAEILNSMPPLRLQLGL